MTTHKTLADLNLKKNKCLHCEGKFSYSDKFDAFYCKKCDWWNERICPDKKCSFCSIRPKYPSGKNPGGK